jgi:hypothetical protein
LPILARDRRANAILKCDFHGPGMAIAAAPKCFAESSMNSH